MEEKYSGFNNFEWAGKEKISYKISSEKEPDTFYNVTRQNIFKGGTEAEFDLRYFECGPDGHTTLEKHNHVHVVVVLRGRGSVIVGDEVFKAGPFDMIKIPSWNAHQLINTGEGPFGFLCTVDSKRDKFQLLSRAEVDELIKDNEIKKIIRIPDGYFEQ